VNLIAIQTEATEAILTARDQGKRAASFGMTALNKNPRVIRGIRKRFERQAAKLGFTPVQIAQQWQDVKDIALLEKEAA
jgi:hypothetical protein